MVAHHAEKLPAWRDQMQAGLVWNIKQGLKLTVEEIGRGERLRTALWHRVRTFLETRELLILPTVAVPPTPMAPAKAAPCDSRARRSRRPLPATRSMEFAALRYLDVVMFRSPRRHSYRVPTGHDVGNAAPLWLRCLERRPRITMREPVRCCRDPPTVPRSGRFGPEFRC